jgi:hypothetical protein
MHRLSPRIALTAFVVLAMCHAATAATLYLGDTVTATGTGGSQTLNVFTPSGTTTNGTISPTVSYSLGDSFNEPGSVSTASDFYLPGSSGGPWNFQDDFYFSTTGATIQTAVISNLLSNVSDLQVRLIEAAGNPAPTIGIPAGNTLVDSWQTMNFSGGSYNETLPTGFAAGSYILQIRGEAGNAASYGGSISFTPVPLPSSVWMLLAGMGTVLAVARRRAA